MDSGQPGQRFLLTIGLRNTDLRVGGREGRLGEGDSLSLKADLGGVKVFTFFFTSTSFKNQQNVFKIKSKFSTMEVC